MVPGSLRRWTVAARFVDLGLRALLGLGGAIALLTALRATGPVSIASPALAAITIASPLSGLLILASVVPIGPALGSLAGSASWSEPLVIAFLAGAALRGAFHAGASRIVPRPAALLALAIVCSAAVQLALRRVLIGSGPFLDEMAQLLAGGYFSLALELGSLTGAALFLEGMSLLVAVGFIVGGGPERLASLVRMMVVGAAAAAALNVFRLVDAALAAGTWSALAQIAGTRRISVLYGDVNAAGSYFAMLLCLALGVASSAERLPRLVGIGSAVLIAVALWLTSSRAALISVLLIGAVSVGLAMTSAARTRVWSRMMIRAAGLIAVALLVIAFLPNRVFGGNAAGAAAIRRDLAIVSVRLLASAPVFGIGVGEFYERSGDEMRQLPVGRIYPRQNAHNNFLQVLAELGVAGFACFALVLWSVVRGLRVSSQPQPGALPGIRPVAAALAAFLVSALFGHPLLVPECAYAFWVLAGAAASFAPQRAGAGPTRLLALTACAVLLISVPIRARAVVRTADLEHLGYGLSQWQPAEDGERYRIATGRATVFVPGDAVTVRIPLRAAPASVAPVAVDVRLHGALVDRVQVTGTSWSWYHFTVPSRERARFIPLELELADGHGADLHVGKVFVVVPRTR